jgi:hypothetical protein
MEALHLLLYDVDWPQRFTRERPCHPVGNGFLGLLYKSQRG